MPNCAQCSSSSAPPSNFWQRSCQAAWLHISIRVFTPTTTTSPSNPAYSRSDWDSKIRPCLSRLRLTARANNMRSKSRRPGSVRGRSETRLPKTLKSGRVKMNKQPSSPYVTTSPSLNSGRNLAGRDTRPLASIVWLNSPRNTRPPPTLPTQGQYLGKPPTFPHHIPPIIQHFPKMYNTFGIKFKVGNRETSKVFETLKVWKRRAP
jgi:hypothetical protein